MGQVSSLKKDNTAPYLPGAEGLKNIMLEWNAVPGTKNEDKAKVPGQSTSILLCR